VHIGGIGMKGTLLEDAASANSLWMRSSPEMFSQLSKTFIEA